jgi:hypothetical protein
MVPRQPPPSFFAPYPAINALSQLGMVNKFCKKRKILCHGFLKEMQQLPEANNVRKTKPYFPHVALLL